MPVKPIIALDADGVLLNYHQAYAQAWGKAFGKTPTVRDHQAYWPVDRWDVRQLAGDELTHFRTFFDNAYWSTIPAVAGSVDACHALVAGGYELVCVSAIKDNFTAARLENLRVCGFPIERVIATPHERSEISPKATALRELRPVAFVDDFLPYFRGIPNDIHAALILREPNGSPNIGNDLAWTQSQHSDLASFAAWWLSR